MIRVLVVDDQVLVRAGVASLLRAATGFEVVGDAADGNEAVHLAYRLRPDVVMMDVRMPYVDGIEATRRIVRQLPDTRVVMLTTFADEDYIYGALHAGAVGFLLKDSEPTAMIDAVRRAAAGDAPLSPSVLARVLARAMRAHTRETAPPAQPDAALGRLTSRERQILALVGAGLSNAEIGERLYLGTTTVKTHVSAAMDKLGVRNRVQAAVVAHRLGLVDDAFQPRDDPGRQ
jgi:DNA-binding NarL/FixJ family response regulator